MGGIAMTAGPKYGWLSGDDGIGEDAIISAYDDDISFDDDDSPASSTPTSNTTTGTGTGRDDFEFSLFTSAKATTPQESGRFTWPEFVDFCRDSHGDEYHRSHKLNAPAIIGGRCAGSRSNNNVRFLSMVAADFDIGPDDPRYRTFDDMVHHLMEHDIACVAYTTTSNTAGHNRYRVIMPLGHNVDASTWLTIWRAANNKFQGAFDAATKDPARLSFLPATWVGDTFTDARKGQVTLTGAFNDFAANAAGRPILDCSEIKAALATALPNPATSRPTPRRPASQTSGASLPNPATSRAHPQTALALTAVPFGLIRSEKGPLVSHWMRHELPKLEGSRTYRFLQNAAMRAQAQGLTINIDVLTALATNWLLETRNAPPPHDLERQAQNALDFASQQQRKVTM